MVRLIAIRSILERAIDLCTRSMAVRSRVERYSIAVRWLIDRISHSNADRVYAKIDLPIDRTVRDRSFDWCKKCHGGGHARHMYHAAARIASN